MSDHKDKHRDNADGWSMLATDEDSSTLVMDAGGGCLVQVRTANGVALAFVPSTRACDLRCLPG